MGCWFASVAKKCNKKANGSFYQDEGYVIIHDKCMSLTLRGTSGCQSHSEFEEWSKKMNTNKKEAKNTTKYHYYPEICTSSWKLVK